LVGYIIIFCIIRLILSILSMNNSDSPAMPIVDFAPGLTKREAFIMAAMQGLCANPNTNTTGQWQEKLAKDAVFIADVTLKEFEQ